MHSKKSTFLISNLIDIVFGLASP